MDTPVLDPRHGLQGRRPQLLGHRRRLGARRERGVVITTLQVQRCLRGRLVEGVARNRLGRARRDSGLQAAASIVEPTETQLNLPEIPQATGPDLRREGVLGGHAPFQ